MSLFDLLTAFDWISPAVGLLEEAGGMTGMAINDPADIERLKRAGVRVGKTPHKTAGKWIITVDDPKKAKRVLR